MSKALVRRWYRLEREWRAAADRYDVHETPAAYADCCARAQIFRVCADSLQSSLKRLEQKRREKGEGK